MNIKNCFIVLFTLIKANEACYGDDAPIKVYLWYGQSNMASRRHYDDFQELMCSVGFGDEKHKDECAFPVNLSEQFMSQTIKNLKKEPELNTRHLKETSDAMIKYLPKYFFNRSIWEPKVNDILSMRVRFERPVDRKSGPRYSHQTFWSSPGDTELQPQEIGIDTAVAQVFTKNYPNQKYMFATVSHRGQKLSRTFMPGKRAFVELSDLIDNLRCDKHEGYIRYDETIASRRPMNFNQTEMINFMRSRPIEIAGFVYFQGASDRKSRPNRYKENLLTTIDAMNEKIFDSGIRAPNFKMAIVGIGQSNRINKVQEEVAHQVGAIWVDGSKYSRKLHYTVPAYLAIGTELAEKLVDDC